MRIKENHHAAEEEKTSERSVKVLLSGMFSRKKKKRSAPPNEDSCLMMKRDKTNNKNVHMSLSEMMRRLKHSFINKEKPQHDNKRLLVLGKNKGKSLSTTTTTTKDHFFLERMTSTSQKRFVVKEKKHNLSSENGDSDQHLATSEEYAQRNMVSLLPGYSSPFRSPGKIWDQKNPTLLSRSAPDDFMKSETLAGTQFLFFYILPYLRNILKCLLICLLIFCINYSKR